MPLHYWTDGDVLTGSGYASARDFLARAAAIAANTSGLIARRETYASATATVSSLTQQLAGYHGTGATFSLITSASTPTTQTFIDGAIVRPSNVGYVRFFGLYGVQWDEGNSAAVNGSVWTTGGKPNAWVNASSHIVVSGAAGSVITIMASGLGGNADVSGTTSYFSTKFWMNCGSPGGVVTVGIQNAQGSQFSIKELTTNTITDLMSGCMDVAIQNGRVYFYGVKSADNIAAATEVTASIAINGPWYPQFWVSGGQQTSIAIDYLRVHESPSLGSFAYIRFAATGTYNKASSTGLVYSGGGVAGFTASAMCSGTIGTGSCIEIRGYSLATWADVD